MARRKGNTSQIIFWVISAIVVLSMICSGLFMIYQPRQRQPRPTVSPTVVSASPTAKPSLLPTLPAPTSTPTLEIAPAPPPLPTPSQPTPTPR